MFSLFEKKKNSPLGRGSVFRCFQVGGRCKLVTEPPFVSCLRQDIEASQRCKEQKRMTEEKEEAEFLERAFANGFWKQMFETL